MAMADGDSPAIAAVCSTDSLGSSRLELIRRIELEGDRRDIPRDLGKGR